MSKDLKKAYDHSQVEEKLYTRWMEKGYFSARPNPDKKPFTIVIPPPNITGQLHMGHGLDNAIQDAIIRFKRMQGFETLWLPGTDHASIATEVKVVNQLAEQGIKKEDIGREEFLKHVWAWKDEYGGRIVNQLKKLGSSCDWEKERFTMDEGCNHAVKKVFVQLYEKGLIYRGNRIINWCPHCHTALSDAEVEYAEQPSHLWHVRYDSEDGKQSITVATTRPETMLGDTAVAVNPADERYADLIGKNVILPLVGKPIPVVADEYVDLEFGTGAVKITPAHDPNDFEVASRHNLPIIRVLTDDGKVNENGGKYEGMDRYEARKAIVADLEKTGNLVKIEDYAHNVGECYRCHTTVEPIISRQWFVAMKELAEPAMEVVRNGQVKFVPERFSKIYFNWMENIKDWCISRQLWWGHRIPAYYCQDCGQMVVAMEQPEACPKCGCQHFHQDEDVLDTWFSSGLWPFSTLGWPEQTAELEYFYPTNVLVTGYDIIFFWVARMIVFGMEVMGRPPFEYVNIHGIVRDSQGRKMSKSLNNGIDPLKIIEQYGADALRFSLANGTSPGSDMRFYDKKVEAAGNFANKIWNASRFVAMNLQDQELERDITKLTLDISDRWILSRLNGVIKDVTENLEKFEMGLATAKIYDFIWSEYCDWYIEMCKSRLYGEDAEAKKTAISVLYYVLVNALKLLHPFMPFITEEIFVELLEAGESIMISDWPKCEARFLFAEEEQSMLAIMDVVRSVRNTRAEMNVPPAKKAKIIISTAREEIVRQTESYLLKLAGGSEVQILPAGAPEPENCAAAIVSLGQVYLPLGDLIDVEKERARLLKEQKSLEGEIARAKGKLSNQGFLAKAPQAVVQEEKDKLNQYQEMLERVTARIASLGAL